LSNDLDNLAQRPAALAPPHVHRDGFSVGGETTGKGTERAGGGGNTPSERTDCRRAADDSLEPGRRDYGDVIPPQNSILLSIEQVCIYLGGISRRKVYEMVSSQQLPAPIKFDRVARWKRKDLDEWADNLTYS
jgi:excisionase family DNA binding protein